MKFKRNMRPREGGEIYQIGLRGFCHNQGSGVTASGTVSRGGGGGAMGELGEGECTHLIKEKHRSENQKKEERNCTDKGKRA